MVSRPDTRARSAFLVASALAFSLGCAQSRTEVIVVTDTDLRGPGGIDNIIATVTGPDGATQMSTARLGPDQPPLPRTLGLVWDGGRLGPFTVRLSGNTGGATRVQRTARFSFQEGRTLMLRMDLLARCEATSCAAEQTCAEAGCRTIDVGADELSPWTGTPPPLEVDAGPPPPDAGPPEDAGPPPPDAGPPPSDAGSPDTGVDSCVPMPSELCNAADDDCDGTVDEGFDLDADEANCGACGHACDFRNATGACTAGACAITACDAMFDDCNGMGDDGCEASLADDEMNCGTCGTRCNMGSSRTCCAGTCQRTCP